MSRPAETQGYGFNHTMIRVKDPKPSLEFYQLVSERARHVPYSQVPRTEKEFESFTLYFLGYDHGGDSIKESHVFEREAILELTHNHGTETDENFQGYASGNAEPKGFGHIAITVPNIQEACERFEKLNVPFKKRLTDGKMKEIAFILDPDGYWVEIIQSGLRL